MPMTVPDAALQQSGAPASPADLARASLKRLAELKLPPTPENYARFYAEADTTRASVQRSPIRRAVTTDGSVAPVAGAGFDPALMARFEHLVGAAVETTGGLNDGLSQGGSHLAQGLDQLVRDPHVADGGASRLLAEMAAATRDIHQIVRASHEELLNTQRGLATIKSELAESRRLLEQDPLTGSENRRSMEGILAREIATARRNGEPLAVAMIDIDHFKQVNDTHGHPAGDAALIHLTRAAKALLRGNDSFVRYGGDEFVLVLPDTDLKGGVVAGERLRAVLARQPLLHGQEQITLTLSGGVTCFLPNDDGASLLARADAALYEAKRAGRDRVCAG